MGAGVQCVSWQIREHTRFLPRDGACPCLPRTPQNLNAPPEHICEQTENPHNRIDGFSLWRALELCWQERTEVTLSQERDLGLSEPRGLHSHDPSWPANSSISETQSGRLVLATYKQGCLLSVASPTPVRAALLCAHGPGGRSKATGPMVPETPSGSWETSFFAVKSHSPG